MRIAPIAIGLFLLTGEANAISRYVSTSMDCAEVQATLREEGAAILRYRSTRNPSLPLYGRYVSDRRFCQMDEVTESVSIPAADTKSCTVRQCKQVEFDEPILLRRWHRHR